MVCNNCKIKPVWKFTNQIELCKNCFCDYFERKVFATIRKYKMLSSNKKIIIKKDNSVNSNVLVYVLSKKLSINYSSKPTLSSESLSQNAEEFFLSVLKGKFKKETKKSPLSFLSDKEIELYARINNIKGEIRKSNLFIQNLFNRFNKKNPDLEHNIMNAQAQIP